MIAFHKKGRLLYVSIQTELGVYGLLLSAFRHSNVL
jgi:hypothetical protein